MSIFYIQREMWNRKNTAFSNIPFLKIYTSFQIKFLVIITGSCFSKQRNLFLELFPKFCEADNKLQKSYGVCSIQT